MNFVNQEHKDFYYKNLEELCALGKLDCYNDSLIYTLGMCKETRNNFDKIVNLKNGKINLKALEDKWQTGTSKKVTRLALNLWNGCNYDNMKDYENNRVSTSYNPSELFSCNLAPYFYESIKLRFPEFTEDEELEEINGSNESYGYNGFRSEEDCYPELD